MILRNIQTTTSALDTLIKIKALEKDWATLIIEAKELDELHIIFEDMFFESISKAHMRLLVEQYHHLSLSEKEMFVKEMLDKYKTFGQHGFHYIVFHPLMNLTRKLKKSNKKIKHYI